MDTVTSSQNSTLSNIPGLVTLSEWNANRASAATTAPDQSKQPPSKKQKVDKSTENKSPLPPRARGEYAAKLNNLCQLHRLRADFEYAEESPQSFIAELRIFNAEGEMLRSWDMLDFLGMSSKKAAKEIIAKNGVEWLETRKVESKEKTSEVDAAVVNEVDRSENWVGVLNEHCQSTHQSLPDFDFYDLGSQRFGATCSINGTLYYDPNTPHANKKNAKSAAAHAAVISLRNLGVLKQKGAKSFSVPPVIPAFSTQVPSSQPLPTTSTRPTVSLQTPSLTNLTPPSPNYVPIKSPSAASQVTTLCSLLALTPPVYHIQTSPSTDAFWDGHARFEGALDVELRGKVAEDSYPSTR